jgi:hypothetical protein
MCLHVASRRGKKRSWEIFVRNLVTSSSERCTTFQRLGLSPFHLKKKMCTVWRPLDEAC